MIENDYNYKPMEWQSFAVGIFVGFIITLIFSWYITKDEVPYSWCFYLSESKSEYCVDLYNQATEEMQKESEFIESQYDGAFYNDGFR